MKQDHVRPASTEELLLFLESAPIDNPLSGNRPEGAEPDDPEGKAGRKRSCPPPSAYMSVVLGSCERSVAQALLDHAAACSACAQALQASLQALEGDPSPDEIDALAGLPMTQPHFLREISAKLADSDAGRRPFLPSTSSRRLAWLGAAAAVAIAAAGTLWVWKERANAPEHLLARAYQSSRTLELRIPGAGFSALKTGVHTRGDSRMEEAPALLEARAALARKLEQSPQDDRALSLSARADLLEEHYDAAIDKLDRLIARGPVTVELLTDAATAYFERGLVTGRELDRTVALDDLHHAELLAPSNAVVLFNEAIVMEDRGQLLNAAETWKRYLTVEHDPAWAAEGKRRQAALETTLDKLKSHESRLLRMLSSPQAMLALASDEAKLAQWDEELSSVELDKLTTRAFPATLPVSSDGGKGARASPCQESCLEARQLLYAVGISLKQRHHDEWLNDLFPSSFLPASFEEIPSHIQRKYARAMYLLGSAARQNQSGQPETGASEALESRRLFLEIAREKGGSPPLRKTGEAGAWRAAAEYLFSLQRETNFAGCRAFAKTQLGGARQPGLDNVPRSYPWIAGLFGITEKICDDTPRTREEGKAVAAEALRRAVDSHYQLLTARIHLHIGNSSEAAGDEELNREQKMNALRELLRGDPPLIRIVNTQSALTFTEVSSPWLYLSVLSEQEMQGWARLAGDWREEIVGRMRLGMAKIRLGFVQEGEAEFRSARGLAAKRWPGERVNAANNGAILTEIAETLLERGETAGALHSLQAAQALHETASDEWLLGRNAVITAQLQLEERNYAAAERVLQAQIRRQEDTAAEKTNPTDASITEKWGIAVKDHDLYGELAAVWLGEGRPAADVLALWERFLLRAQGLPVERCQDGGLSCEREAIEVESKRIGSSLLSGQIVLMDRVLIYEMDQDGVRWETRRYNRRSLLNAMQTMEWAVSSPYASPATVQLLGRPLADALLPASKKELPQEVTLLLEPDPELHRLAWAALPTSQGPLGLHVAIAEIPSVLAEHASASAKPVSFSTDASPSAARPLVIGASVAGGNAALLPEAIEEARRVGAYLHAPELLLGSQATAHNVAAEMSHASLLHFAGHAVQDDWGMRLLLAYEPEADAHLDAPEPHPWIDEAFLRTHPPRACRLAVLSACATGGNAPSGQAPLRDLVKMLYSLGVPEVVATRWPVDSEASVTFMKAFYSSLDSGQDVAHALRSARLAQSKIEIYENPYFWGAYYATGREEFSFKGERHANANDRGGLGRTQERSFQGR